MGGPDVDKMVSVLETDNVKTLHCRLFVERTHLGDL